MTKEKRPLCFTDPKKFMRLVRTEDPQARLDGLKDNIQDIAICEIVRLGIHNKPEMAAELRQLYRGFIMLASEEDRWTLYQHIKGFVENTSFVSTGACLPFIRDDSSLRIVSTAVIDYVSLGRIVRGDPMGYVKDIIELIEGSALRSEGAAFGGLLQSRRQTGLQAPAAAARRLGTASGR